MSKKISEWLTECVSSHGIYDAWVLREDFERETGVIDARSFPAAPVKAHRAAIHERGLGGYVTGPDDAPAVSGYSLACGLAAQFAPSYRRTKEGRGSAFWEAVKALEDAGR